MSLIFIVSRNKLSIRRVCMFCADTISGSGYYLECCYFSMATCSACLNKPSTTITKVTAIHGKQQRDHILVCCRHGGGGEQLQRQF